MFSPPTVRMLKAFWAQCPKSTNCSKCTFTHTHRNIHTYTHPGVAAVASDTKERTTGVSWRLQVTNTCTEELILVLNEAI